MKQKPPPKYNGKPMRREAATTVRQRMYGPANQIAYEATERREREAMKKKIGKNARRGKAPRKAKDGTGVNAGTMGGARSLMSSWLNSAK